MSLSKLIAKKLSFEEQAQLIKALRTEILAHTLPQSIILFGSASRHEMTEVSDLDVIVVVENTIEIKPTLRALRMTSVQLNWPIDILVVDRKTFDKKSAIGGVFFIAKQEGVVLFDYTVNPIPS